MKGYLITGVVVIIGVLVAFQIAKAVPMLSMNYEDEPTI